MKTLYIASDHAGFDLKEFLKKNLTQIEWKDMGPQSADRCDYPDYAEKVAEKISKDAHATGVLICGSGIGMSIAANRFSGVRAAVVESEQTAALAKQHNNANILCLGARILKPEQAAKILLSWLNATFEDGRHLGRIHKIDKIDSRLKKQVKK